MAWSRRALLVLVAGAAGALAGGCARDVVTESPAPAGTPTVTPSAPPVPTPSPVASSAAALPPVRHDPSLPTLMRRTFASSAPRVYIEASKTSINRPILSWALATSLQLAHPFAPFVTETIWQTLNYTEGLLMADKWPVIEKYDEIAAATFDRLQELVNEGRWVIAELPGNKKYKLLYANDSLIEANEQLVRHMLRLEAVEKIDQPRGLRLAVANREAWLDIDSETLYEHQTNLELRLVDTRNRVKNLEARLANDNYIAKAPQKLIDETRQELADLQQLTDRLVAELNVIQLS